MGEVATRFAQKFNIQLPQLGLVPAIAGDVPTGRSFEVEMPADRGVKPVHMDAGNGPGDGTLPGGHGPGDGTLPGGHGPGDSVPSGNLPTDSTPGGNLPGDATADSNLRGDTAPGESAPSGHVPEAGAADNGAGPRRFTEDDLHGPPLRDTTYGQEMRLGPDDKYHFEGDPEGTHRNRAGRLVDEQNHFIPDDNAPNTGQLDQRATPDLGTRHELTAETGDGPAGAGVDRAVEARTEITIDRDELWREDIAPIAEKLKDEGIEVNEKTLAPDNIDDLLDQAEDHLTPQELATLEKTGKRYNELTAELRRASERLGTAGGDLLEAREFPDAKRITGGDGEPGTPGNLDRVLFDEKTGELIAIEEKGAGSTLGSRLVDNPNDPAGKATRAEQMSPEYLRSMLENDNKLAEALRNDPELRQQIQEAINNGNVRYLLTQTSKDGVVTITEYTLDPGRMHYGSFVVAGSQ